ncbi:hypothetical protein [Dactylosporangium sp. NPDC000521]|uniref:hypothetical protein n=1 Tax=Dactylosporangium sp. NPDC000521 TaxID=3363975 RepID=UPI003685D095
MSRTRWTVAGAAALVPSLLLAALPAPAQASSPLRPSGQRLTVSAPPNPADVRLGKSGGKVSYTVTLKGTFRGPGRPSAPAAPRGRPPRPPR